MTQDEFNTQMSRMYEAFGAKAFTTERVKLVYSALAKLSGAQFAKVVTHFILSSKTAPMPREIIDAGFKEFHSNRNFDVFIRQENNCHWCSDAGFNFIKRRSTGQKLYIVCDCDVGKKRSEDTVWFKFPVWVNSYLQYFERINMEEVGYKSYVPVIKPKNITPYSSEILEITNKHTALRKESLKFWEGFFQSIHNQPDGAA